MIYIQDPGLGHPFDVHHFWARARALTSSVRVIPDLSHIPRNSPPLSYRATGVSNSCSCISQNALLWNQIGDTHPYLPCLHDQYPIPRHDSSQAMRDAKQCLALEFSMYRVLNFGIRLQVCGQRCISRSAHQLRRSLHLRAVST